MRVLQFWASHQAEFGALLLQHLFLVAVSTVVAVVIGLPLGILAARRPRVGAPIVWLVNAAQTVPSLAMFGFLLPLPLIGGLGARVAITVLIVYALLPIVRTTIDLARNLGLEVVAEGVETAAILRDLGDLSCDVAQGFFLYGFEPGGNRIEVTTGGYFVYDPDFEPITWTPAERARGQYWGVKTIESFHTYGTPDVDGDD